MAEVARADHLQSPAQPGVATDADPGLDRLRPGTLGRLELVEETDDLYRLIVRLVPEHPPHPTGPEEICQIDVLSRRRGLTA